MEEHVFLRRVIDSVPGHLYWKGLDGCYLGCNLQQAKSLNLNLPEDIVGKSDYDLPWAENAEELIKADKLVMQKKESIFKEEIVDLPGYEAKRVFLSQKMPLYDEEGRVKGIIGVSLDITVLKEAQMDLEASNKEREKVLARHKNFVLDQEHDIRTPVSNVIALSNLLYSQVTEPDLKELAWHLKESAQAQMDYQNSMIDTIYLFNDETELYQRRFSLKEKVESVISMFLCSFKDKSLKFEFEYDDAIPEMFMGDWFRMQQFLMRLLSNAVEFTDVGGRIWVRCGKIKQADKQVILSFEVEDTGIGIDASELDTIFEPFVKLTLSNVGKYEGRGVGLTFVKKLVDDLGGELDVKSTVGKGSLFFVLLPFDVSLFSEPTPELQD